MNYSRLASSFINFNKSSFLPCSQQCCQLGYDEVSPLFLVAFFIWSRFTYLRALVITKGLAADSANLEEVYNEQKRQQNSPNLSGDHKALSLHREDGFTSTERDSAATCWPSEQECSPSGRWPGYHSSCEALLIFHTDSLSWNCSYVSNVSPEKAHCDVYEPVLFRKHLCASAINNTCTHCPHSYECIHSY